MREYRVCRVGVPIWIELETIEQLEAPECGRVLGEITQKQKDIYAVLGSENPRDEFQEFKAKKDGDEIEISSNEDNTSKQNGDNADAASK